MPSRTGSFSQTAFLEKSSRPVNHPVMASHLTSKPRARPTVTLIFTVLITTLGTWYNGGFFTVVLNIPQTYVIRWIRLVECGRHSPEDNHTLSYQLWCDEISDENEPFLLRDNTKLNALWGVMNSVVDIGILLSAFTANYLINRFGLKGTIYLGAGLFFLGSIISALITAFHAYEFLIIGRLLCGMAQGISGIPSALYLPEIAPVELRGAVGTVPIIMMVTGILSGNLLSLPMVLGTESRWPILITLQSIPVLLMCLCLPFCPNSPRRLLARGDREGAQKALVWLRRTQAVQDEFQVMEADVKSVQIKGTALQQVSMWGVLKDPFLRYILSITAVAMIAKQFSGYMCIFYYSTSIFQSVGLDHLNSAYATAGMWVVYIISALISMSIVDRIGRKFLLLFSHSGMIICMTLFTVFMVLSSRYEIDWAKYACAGSMLAFIATYATGSASVPWVLPAELFPENARTAGMTYTSVLCSGAGLVTTLIFPFLVFILEEYTFLLFVASVALATVFLLWRQPETKGLSQSEIQMVLRKNFK